MGTNSIRANLEKCDIISEIRLYLGADVQGENVFLVVEGEDDIKFWKNIVNEKVTIFESFSGKEGIREIIKDHFSSNPRVIGIRDRDYESTTIDKRIFYYDYSCMEIMLIKSPEAFDSIYHEYYSGQLSTTELRDMLLAQLKYLSIIRKNNEVQRLEIKIEGVSINSIFDSITKTVSNEKVISRLNQINQNYFEINPDKKSQIDEEYTIYLNSEELMLITQGHDFISLFSAHCRKPRGSCASDRNIASSLRCAYRKADFICTSLYSQIESYQTRYNLDIVT